ncbi:MAG: hypothetical protein WC843_00300 [Candidatus Gracilibacteria bacterium]|jgi:hypothetical protein
MQITKIPNKELLRLCRECGSNIRKLQKQFAVYLIEVANRGMYREFGFHSIREFAAKLAGMGHETVDKILRIDKKLENMPLLRALMVEQGWAKLELVANIATPETEKIWVEKVQTMTYATLQAFTKEIRDQQMRENLKSQIDGSASGTSAQKNLFDDRAAVNSAENDKQENVFTHESTSPQQQAIFEASVAGKDIPAEDFQKTSFNFHIKISTEMKFRLYKHKLEKQLKKVLNWDEVLEYLLDEREASQSGTVKVAEIKQKTSGKDVPKGAKKSFRAEHVAEIKSKNISTQKEKSKHSPAKPTRHIPAEIQRQLKEKYGEMCGYPGCKNPAINQHHAKRFSLEMLHDSNSIVPLCKIHHQFAHHGLIKNEELSPINNQTGHQDRNPQTGVQNWKIQLEADKSSPKFKIDQMVIAKRMANSG